MERAADTGRDARDDHDGHRLTERGLVRLDLFVKTRIQLGRAERAIDEVRHSEPLYNAYGDSLSSVVYIYGNYRFEFERDLSDVNGPRGRIKIVQLSNRKKTGKTGRFLRERFRSGHPDQKS